VSCIAANYLSRGRVTTTETVSAIAKPVPRRLDRMSSQSDLRQATGSMVGANLDRSHLFCMGADPLAAIEALGEAIHHVHAKNTYFNDGTLNLTGRLETSDLRMSRTALGVISLWESDTESNGGVGSVTVFGPTVMTVGCRSSMKTSFSRRWRECGDL
jgi:hypothetical protein